MSAAVRTVWLLAAALALAGPDAARAQDRKLDLLWEKFAAELTAAERAFDGVMGIAVKDLTDGRTFQLNADEVMPTASMIKIAVLAELFRQNRGAELYRYDAKDGLPGDDILARLTTGTTSLTLRDVGVLMVAVSDNSATNVLIDRLGMARINRTLDSLGLRATRLNRRMLDIGAAREGRENLASPAEMVRLLEAIHQGRVFPAERLGEFLTILGMHKEGYLARDLPEGTPLANKPGWLEGVRTDAALGTPPGRPFAISVMTTYGPADRRAEDAIAAIGRLAYRFFERLGGSSAWGRDLR
ncbi:MAG: serine hydrolase [Gemmatimonadales bacterium]